MTDSAPASAATPDPRLVVTFPTAYAEQLRQEADEVPNTPSRSAARQQVETYHGVCDCEAVLWLEVENVTRAPAIGVAARCPNCMQPVTLGLRGDDDSRTRRR